MTFEICSNYFWCYLGLLHAVVEWMVTYHYALENLAPQFSGRLLQAWKILWTTKSCEPSNVHEICFNLIYGHWSAETSCNVNHFSASTFLCRCAIYRLPDKHKHITRPPKGVKYPKKVIIEFLLCCLFYTPFAFQFLTVQLYKFIKLKTRLITITCYV